MSAHQPQSTKILAALLVASVLFAAGYALKHTFSCFLLSFVIAYLLDPLLVMLERRRIRRNHSIFFIYLILTVFSIFFFAFFVPFLTTRWNSLLLGLPGYLQKGKELAVALKAKQNYTPEWGWLLENVADLADKLIAKAGEKAYSAAGKMAFNVINLVLAPILVFFMLFYKEETKASIVSWLPESYRERLIVLGGEINDSVGGYIRGQLVVSAIVAVLSSAALLYLDVEYPFINGIFAGLASTLPFIGVIIATIPALFFAYVKFQTGIALVKVIAAFSVIYFVEGYVIKPLVFKQALDLNPLITIIFVMAFGELMGFWGILLAIPIAAAVKIIMEHFQKGDFAEKA